MKKILHAGSLFLLSLLFSVVLVAQKEKYSWDEPVPIDPEITIGKLDNGLTYYIRNNEFPEDRAEFYLVVNAGAILEDEDQDGLAHFCEHMAFNGTRNFEKHDIINYLQSIGMKFGPEINAFTSHDVTNYMLQKVPTDVPENIDTSLLILYDWANNIAFEDEEIDNERGVIHEEWRTRRGAQFRMQTETNKVLFKGSKYAERDVIGDIDIIDNFEYDVIRRFYDDWYRPDLQAIIAVGDFDVDVVEKKITDLFSRIPERPDPKERETFPVPGHEETYVAIETDPEAQYAMVQVYYKHDPVEEKDMEYWRTSLVHQLYNTMLNNRLQELLQEADPPFMYGYSAYTSLVRSKDAYISFAVAKNDGIKRTLETMLTENQRVLQHGFTESELERTRRQMLSRLETQYNERDKQKSRDYVWKYFSHFLEDDPIPGIEKTYAFAQDVLPGITLKEVNSLASKWITDENRVVVITAPESEDVAVPQKEEVMAVVASVDQAETEPYVDDMADKPLMAEKPEPGKVTEKKVNEALGTEEWILSNGVRVVLKPTDFKDDQILMTAYSMGGTSLYALDDLISAEYATGVANQSGIADFDKTQLDKLMAGKVVRVSPLVGSMYEGFSGSSSKKDLETMFKLLNLYFTQPRFGDKAFKAYMQRMKGFLENRQNDPGAAMQDTIQVTMAQHHPRVRPRTAELLDEARLNRIRFIYNERFGDPSGFNFYFVGNIDPDSLQSLAETYLGSLPKVRRNETFIDHNIRPPEETVEKVIYKDMEVPKGTVYISYPGEYDYNDAKSRMELAALCDILDIRYVETIREEQGGTYGVSIYDAQTKYPYAHYVVVIRFDCDPENTDKLKGIAYEEIEKLKDEGPKMKDLKAVQENMLKTRKENLKENRFWLNTLKGLDYDRRDPEDFFQYEEYVNDLSIKGLKKAAKKFFGGEHVEIILLPTNTEESIKNPMME